MASLNGRGHPVGEARSWLLWTAPKPIFYINVAWPTPFVLLSMDDFLADGGWEPESAIFEMELEWAA